MRKPRPSRRLPSPAVVQASVEPGRSAAATCRTPAGAHRALAVALCLAASDGASVAARQESSPSAPAHPELVTDRPDQTESTALVPPGRSQLEIGATRTRDDAAGEEMETLEVPASLLRIGLSERVELRLGWSGWLDQEVRGGGERQSADGAGDAELGAKLLLREGGGGSPRIALIAVTSVPVGDDAFTSDRFDPGVRLTVSHELTGGIGLGWNVGVETASEPVAGGHSTLSTAIYTLAAGFPAGERLGFFAELFGEVPTSAPGGPAHLVDAGVTYLLLPHLQLDVAAGAGLSDAAPDWFAGVGLSVRMPR